MLPIRAILHPTDFSEQSAYAFQLACSLARDHGATLVMLHVAPPPQMLSYEGMPLTPALPVGYNQQLEDRLRQVRPTDPNIRVEYFLGEGAPSAEIVRVAQEFPCDLVVMGTHGRTGLGRLLMGSVAEQVVRRAPCPVLTVKSPLSQQAAENRIHAEATAPGTGGIV